MRHANRASLAPLLLLLLVPLLSQNGCAHFPQRHAVPPELVNNARVPGFENIRTWGDDYDPVFQEGVIKAMRQRLASDSRHNGAADVLAISGGGSGGAFGAGLMCGWSESGARPQFAVVTGISTGAFIAPFAFVGPQYDAPLKEIYTTLSPEKVMHVHGVLDLFLSDSAADNKPLRRLTAHYINQELLEAVAREHAKGRRLYVGTTNLDAQRPVIWDMGAIAASGRPDALALFQNVLLASGSVPGILPPIYLKVEAGGKVYDEMHVDGGATRQVFHLGFLLGPNGGATKSGAMLSQPHRLFIIRNWLMRPEWMAMRPRAAAIINRAVFTLVKWEALGDIFRLYALCRRDGIDFNLAYIPDYFISSTTEEFNRKEMNRLFKLGYDLARPGYPWSKVPPGPGWENPAGTRPTTQRGGERSGD